MTETREDRASVDDDLKEPPATTGDPPTRGYRCKASLTRYLFSGTRGTAGFETEEDENPSRGRSTL